MKESQGNELTVKDVLIQCEIDGDKGKKNKRWIVVTSSTILIKKDFEDNNFHQYSFLQVMNE